MGGDLDYFACSSHWSRSTRSLGSPNSSNNTKGVSGRFRIDCSSRIEAVCHYPISPCSARIHSAQTAPRLPSSLSSPFVRPIKIIGRQSTCIVRKSWDTCKLNNFGLTPFIFVHKILNLERFLAQQPCVKPHGFSGIILRISWKQTETYSLILNFSVIEFYDISLLNV